MAYPLTLLILIAIAAGFLLAGRGDLSGVQRRNLLIGLGAAAAVMLGLVVYFITDEPGDAGVSTTESRLLVALEERDAEAMATLTRFAASVMDREVEAARGFMFDEERRLVMCVREPDDAVRGVYMRRNSPQDDFDRDTRIEQSLRDELATFCADAF